MTNTDDNQLYSSAILTGSVRSSRWKRSAVWPRLAA